MEGGIQGSSLMCVKVRCGYLARSKPIMKRWSYVSAPDVEGEDLILLVDVEYLDQRHAVEHLDGL